MGKSEMIEYATKLKLKEDIQKLASLSGSQSFHFALAPNQETPVMVLDKKKAFDRQKFKTALGKKLSTTEVGGVKTDILYIGTLKKGGTGKPEFTIDETKSFGTISTSVFERTVKKFKDVPGCNTLSTPITKLSSVVAREELSETKKQKLEGMLGKKKKVVKDETLSKPEKEVLKTVQSSQKQYDKSEDAKLAEVRAQLNLTGGDLTPQEEYPIKRLGEPGVKGHFTGTATVYKVHPRDGMQGSFDVARGDLCMIQDNGDDAYAYVEIFTRSDEGDVSFTQGKTGYVTKKKIKKDQRYKPMEGPLFPIKPSVQDVSQGNLGDCYFLAAVLSLVDKNPDRIRRMMKDNGDGTITVELFGRDDSGDPRSLKPFYYTVDKTTLHSDDGRDEHARGGNWVEILEKAWAARRAEIRGKSGSYSMEGMAGGSGDSALTALTGVTTTGPGRIKSSKDIFNDIFLHPEVLGVHEIIIGDDQTSALTQLFTKLGLNATGAAKAAGVLNGKRYTKANDLQHDLAKADLLDGNVGSYRFKTGYLTSEDKAVWMGATVTAIGKAYTDGDYTKLTAMAQLDCLKEVGNNSAPRADEVEELLKDPKMLETIGSELLSKLKDQVKGKFPGKRLTGLYSESDLALWETLKKSTSEDSVITVGTRKTVGTKVDSKGHSSGEKVSKGIAGEHEYALLGVYEPMKGEPYYVEPKSGGVPIKYAVLRNPWNDQDPDREDPSAGRIYVAVRNENGRIVAYKPTGSHRSEFLLALSDLTKRYEAIAITEPIRAPWGNVEKERLRNGFKGLVTGRSGLDVTDRHGVTLATRLYNEAVDRAKRVGVEQALEWVARKVSELPTTGTTSPPPTTTTSDTSSQQQVQAPPPPTPDATFTIGTVDFELFLDGGLGPNPTLYFKGGEDPTPLKVSSGSPGSGFTKVEQFCSVLSVVWLKGPGSKLTFSGLSETNQVSAVKALLNMGDPTTGVVGLDNQVNWAVSQLTGAKKSRSQVTSEAAGYRTGTKIWYGNDIHVKAALIAKKGEKVHVYDSNSGGYVEMSVDDFVSKEVPSRDAFVVA
jgi:hypothetical protein